MIHREFRIYMPNIVDTSQVQALKDNKPFLMKAEIPVGSVFQGVVSIPSFIDMMGFSGGGGPPGYVHVVTRAQATEAWLFAAVAPNLEFPDPSDELSPDETFIIEPLGVAQAVGLLFGHFRMSGPGVRSGALERKLTEAGGLVVDMIPYEQPSMLKTLYDPKLQKDLQEALENAKGYVAGSGAGT